MSRAKSRVEEAREILDNKTLKAILDEHEAAIIRRWETSNTTADREACWVQLNATKELRNALDAAATRIEHDPE